MRTGNGSAPCERPHRKLDLTDIMSFHAKKRAFFCTGILSLNGIKGDNFSFSSI